MDRQSVNSPVHLGLDNQAHIISRDPWNVDIFIDQTIYLITCNQVVMR
jgi:hypothetical protein